MVAMFRRGALFGARKAPSRQPKAAATPLPLPHLLAEALEPRLLLSATPGSAAAAGIGTVKAMHDNLDALSTVIGGLDTLAPMTTAVQLVEIGGHGTVGAVFNLATVFNSEVVAPFKAIIDANPIIADANVLATKLDAAITDVIGSGTGKSVSVVNASPDSDTPELHLVLTDQQSIGFTLKLGDTGDTYGIKFADTVGVATISYSFDLDFSAVGLEATSSPTASQGQTAFTLNALNITASFSINTDLAGQDFSFGILKLTIPTGGAATLAEDLTLSLGRSIAVGGTMLASTAAEVKAGTLDALQGGTPFLTHEITAQSEGPVLLDLPVSLQDIHTIEGISPFTDGHIVVHGRASGTDMTVDLSSLTEQLRTATGNPDLDPVGFNNFLMKDLIGKIGSLNSYISDLATKSAELNIDLPFLQDTPLGPLLDTGLAFKHEVIDPLANPALMLGFSEGGSSKSGETWLTGEDIAAADLAALPADLGLKITLDNGLQAELHFTPTYVDGGGDTQQVASLEDLSTAVNQAIAASAVNGWVSATVSGDALRLSIIGSHGEKQPGRISISSPDAATDIRSLGITIARLLHLDGWNDNTKTALDYGNDLLARLGMAYDGEHNGITLTIAKEIKLAEVVAPFAVNLSLGDLAGLSLSNAQFHLDTSVLLSLTLGYSLDPLGAHVNQPGGPQVGDGLNGTPDTALKDLPTYVQATGKAGDIPLTADQVADAKGEPGDPAHTGIKDIQIIGRPRPNMRSQA